MRYRRSVGRGPRSDASDRWRSDIEKWSSREYVLSDGPSKLAVDFIRDDRRRVVTVPLADADEYLAQVLAWFETGDGQPRFSVDEIVAVRGERLAVGRMSVGYSGGLRRETIAVVRFDPMGERTERYVTFEADDLDGALVELDRMHAEMEANDIQPATR